MAQYEGSLPGSIRPNESANHCNAQKLYLDHPRNNKYTTISTIAPFHILYQTTSYIEFHNCRFEPLVHSILHVKPLTGEESLSTRNYRARARRRSRIRRPRRGGIRLSCVFIYSYTFILAKRSVVQLSSGRTGGRNRRAPQLHRRQKCVHRKYSLADML